jgi:tripartite-type tricarboxylate transporter receptor subunit TctC
LGADRFDAAQQTRDIQATVLGDDRDASVCSHDATRHASLHHGRALAYLQRFAKDISVKFRGRVICVMALLATSCAPMAQDYPARPIRIIVPLSPGGASDIIVRSMAVKMSASLGAPLVVENLAGAGSIVGIGAASRAAPDGYTLAVAGSAAFAANPHLHTQLPYKVTDFAPVCRIGGGPYVLVVNPSLGVKSLPDLLALAKSKSLTFASPGVGSSPHMAQEMLKARAGVAFVHVPYRGTSQAVIDTVAGHSQVLFEAPGPLLEHIRAGKLIALGVTSARRVSSLPDVPTFEELGYKGLRLEGWIGLVVPAATPAPVVARVAQACQIALAAPDLQSQAQSLGFEIDYAPPREFGAFMASELQKWGELVRLAGVKPE